MTKTSQAAHLAADLIATAKKAVAEIETGATAGPARKEAPGIIKRTNAYFADPKTIARVDGWNNRFDFGEIEELAKSIKANGLLQPLRVKRMAVTESGKAFELIDGDRRLTAIEAIMKKEPDFFNEGGVPVIIVEKSQDSMVSLTQMFEANTGKPLLPLEEAAAFKRMRDGFPEEGIKGLTIKQICDRVGRKQVHVSAMLALLEAPDDLQEAVKSGKVGSTIAKDIAVATKGDAAKAAELTAQAIAAASGKGGKNAKGANTAVKKAIQTARAAKAASKGKTLKIRALDDAALSDLGAQIAGAMAMLMTNAGKPLDFDLREWVKGDDKLALAATFGALEALKAAAGVKISLEF